MPDDWARPVVRWEIQAKDTAAMRDFYSRMFNWEIGDGPIMNIPAGIGGPEPGPGGHIRASDTSRIVLYIQVRDLRESLDRTKELGGRALMEPTLLPTGQTIAAIADPEGNPIALVQQ